MANVVREDVVKISYDVQQNPFRDVNKDVEEMTSGVKSVTSFTKGLTSAAEEAKKTAGGLADSLKSLPSDAVNAAKNGVTDLAAAAKDAAGNDIKKLTNGLKNLPRTALTATINSVKSLGSTAATTAKKVAGIAGSATIAGIKRLGSASLSAAGSLAKMTAKVTIAGLGAATAGVAGLGVASIKAGAEFESSMSQVAATMGMTAEEANYSNEEYKLLADTAKKMGASTKFSASESAEALNYLALAGYDAEKACSALPTILNLAAAGGMELASASDMVTDAMSALGIEATTDNLTSFGDELAKTAQKSNTSVSQLGEAILTVGGTAKSLSGGTAELNTLLGILADSGTKGAEGGTHLRNIMLSLQSPTDTASKAMKQLGLNVYDSEGKMRSMQDILGDMNSAMSTMTDQQQSDVLSTIFNKTDLQSVNALLANCGDRYDELSGYIKDSSGAMADMADTMNDNLPGRITELKSAAEGAGIAIYEALGSGNLKDIVKDAAGWASELTSATEEGGISGLAGAVGSVGAKALAEVTGMMPQVIDTGVNIVENLLNGIEENSGQISQSAARTGTSFITGVIRLAPRVASTGMRVATELAKGVAGNLPTILATGQEAVSDFIAGAQECLPDLADVAGSIVGTLAQTVAANAPSLIPSGVSAVLSVVQGAASALPSVLKTGVQMASAVIQGVIASLPAIAEQGSQIVHDLISGIVGALPDLALTLVQGLLDILQNLPGLLAGALKGVAGGIIDGIKSWFTDDSAADVGATTAETLAAGITDNTADVTAAATRLSSAALDSITIDLDSVSQNTADIASTFTSGLELQTPAMVQASEDASGEVVTAFDSILDDMHASGSNAGAGFAEGLASQKGNIVAQAQDIASSVSGTINSSLQIHSPSKVAAESGQNYDLGIVKGLDALKGKVATAALNVSGVIRGSSEPVRGTTKTTTIANNRQSASTNNTFAPSFSLAMNGASASESNKRKVKKWIKEGINETFEALERQSAYGMG